MREVVGSEGRVDKYVVLEFFCFCEIWFVKFCRGFVGFRLHMLHFSVATLEIGLV